MTTTWPTADSPQLVIARQRQAFAITQRRPAVLSALAGRPVGQALALVSTLLPVCGNAQAIAGARAVAAACGEPTSGDTELKRERRLLHEQALSSGWRLAVDWPDLLGVSRNMDWLKSLRASERPESAAALLNGVLPPAEAQQSIAALESWALAEPGIAAAMIRRALASPAASEPGSGEPSARQLSGEPLARAARSALETAEFDPQRPQTDPVEVGPLAMARYPLAAELDRERGATGAARLMALLLDMCWIAARLTADRRVAPQGAGAWPEGERAGTGCAVTARGPVFHRVDLTGDGSVARWRALAPTDWHFAARGPLAGLLQPGYSAEDIGLLVAGFDPCVPWELQAEASG